MKKIPTVFKRNYEGDRLVYHEVVPGCEWVLAGEGVPTVKLDGTCCKIENGVLYKRYDRKLSKNAMRKFKRDGEPPKKENYKPAPDGWVAAESDPDPYTGHWPGWVPIDEEKSEDQYHIEAWQNSQQESILVKKCDLDDGTYELIGPKVQGNPHKRKWHTLVRHGSIKFEEECILLTYDGVREFLKKATFAEGIVWHHPDGRMAKIKRRDFGFTWPPKENE